MDTSIPTYFTSGEIAALCGTNFQIASYYIRKLGLHPAAKAGIIRLFTREQAELVREAIANRNAVTTTCVA